MNYRRLGQAGVKVSELSFGTWGTVGEKVDAETAGDLLRLAYDAGVNYFDTAQAYARGNTETALGQVLKQLGWQRETYLLSTKFYWGIQDRVNLRSTLNRKFLLQGLEGSLKRLQLDFVDIIFCHRADWDTPIAETVYAMHDIVESGKAFYWGTSEWSAYEIASAIHIADKYHLHPPVTEQSSYSLLHRERVEQEYARLFRDHHYGEVTFSPLASGLLSGKYNEGIPPNSRATQKGFEWLRDRSITPARIEKVKQLASLASELGCSVTQLSIAWCLLNPNVSSVILGASNPDQLQENLGALDVVPRLTREVAQRVEDIMGDA